jgi:hypothetical protein
MKTYIVITTDGTTQDDCWLDTEMCQVIGKFKAPNAKEAAEMARKNLVEWGYVYPNLRVYELVSFDALDTHGTFRNEDEE